MHKRNLCIITKKNKKIVIIATSVKNDWNNKNVWKAGKPIRSNKSVSNKKKRNLSWKSENSYDWQCDIKNFKKFLLKYCLNLWHP